MILELPAYLQGDQKRMLPCGGPRPAQGRFKYKVK